MPNFKELQIPPQYQLITTNQQLAEVCQRAREFAVVALDTEFERIRTLHPKLGLIQLYAADQVALIDPLAIDDPQPLIDLLADENVLKVLHSSREDLEAFLHYYQQLPTPFMDTQVMARFLNFPMSTGFAKLIKHYFDLDLDKGASRTDWLARPLSDVQLEYAAADVWYLLPLYQQMLQLLEQTPWLAAAQEESASLLDIRSRVHSPVELAYLDISNAWRLTQVELMRLKLLAQWRMEEAIERDLALNFIIREEHLLAVAQNNPKSVSELIRLNLRNVEIRHYGKKLLQILNKAQKAEKNEYPPKIIRACDDKRYKPVIDKLRDELEQITPANLPRDLVASRRNLDGLVKWHWFALDELPTLLTGWRKTYGERLLEILKTFD